MKSCWDPDPVKRPFTSEICEAIYDWSYVERNADQFKRAEEKRLELIRLKKLGSQFTKETHSKAIFTSRPLSTLISKALSTRSSSTISLKGVYLLFYLIRESNDGEY